MVGQPDDDRVFGCALAVCASANTGNGRRHGRQAVHSSNLGVEHVRTVFVVAGAIKSLVSPCVYCADSTDFHSVRDAAGAAVRACCGSPDCGAGKFTFMAQYRQLDVFAAVVVRRGDILEVDGTAPAISQLRTRQRASLRSRALVCPENFQV